MHHTLMLNAGFEPLHILSWQRAFNLVFQDKVEILEEYTASVRTVSRQYRVPAVIRLRRWVNLKRTSPVIRFSRTNLYLRDEYRCQYCLRRFAEHELTLDHVLPAVRGGRKTWENIVTACIRCNQRKGHRTPDEASMSLMRTPVIPRWLPGTVGSLKAKVTPILWEPYLNYQRVSFRKS